jgi:hypothetical protein
VPGDCLALAVIVSGKDDLVGLVVANNSTDKIYMRAFFLDETKPDLDVGIPGDLNIV